MYILFDVGGTKTRIAISEDLESFGEVITFETPEKFEDGILEISRVAKRLSGDKKITAVAGGVAASFDNKKTMLVGGGPNINDWLHRSLKDSLKSALDAEILLENDAAMGGLAQVTYGPAKEAGVAVYMTISTGVGGCRFVDGKIDRSTVGFEPGWQIIGCPEVSRDDFSEERIDWLSGYCSRGYLMSHIGGVCVEKEEGKKPYEITDNAFWDKKAKLLAYGLHNVCVMWSPEIIVLGGSMMNKIGIPIDKVKHYLVETLKDVFPNVMPKIVPAKFGDEMGLYGAMAYLKQKL